MKLQCSEKSISRAFWQRGIHFRPLYEKPDLSPADVTERQQWALEHTHRSPGQWNRYVHAFIDNKTIQVYHTGQARDYAARRQVRGAYRPRSRIFTARYTKPPTTLIQNTGAKSATVTCAIGNGKVLMWHVILREVERKGRSGDVRWTFAACFGEGIPPCPRMLARLGRSWKTTTPPATRAARAWQPRLLLALKPWTSPRDQPARL